MAVRIELLAHRADLDHTVLFEGAGELAQGGRNPLAQHIEAGGGDGERHLEAVAHRQQALGKAFDRELVRLGDVFLGPTPHILEFRPGPHELVEVLAREGLGLRQTLREARFRG